MAAHPSLNQFAYDLIKERILNLQIRGGERIREDVLAEEFQISRTPVREAINRLVAECLIENIPRRGLYCILITREKALEILELRMMFEMFAAYRFAQMATKKHLYVLDSIQQKIDQCKDDLPKLIDGERRFHRTMIEVLHNDLMLHEYLCMDDRMALLRRILIPLQNDVEKQRASQSHHDMLDAFRSKNAAGAARKAEESIEIAIREVERIVADVGWPEAMKTNKNQ